MIGFSQAARAAPPRIVYYTCAEYLRRTGRLLDGGALPEPEPYYRYIKVADIQRVVADHFGIDVSEMVSARRSRDVARPRQVAMFLAKNLTPRSLPEIGRLFGSRDHTTVMHAVRQIKRFLAVDVEMRADVIAILERIDRGLT